MDHLKLKLDYVVMIEVDESFFGDRDNAQVKEWCADFENLLRGYGFKYNLKVVPKGVYRNNVFGFISWTLQIDGKIINVPAGENCIDVYADVFSKKEPDWSSRPAGFLEIYDRTKRIVGSIQAVIEDGIAIWKFKK